MSPVGRPPRGFALPTDDAAILLEAMRRFRLDIANGHLIYSTDYPSIKAGSVAGSNCRGWRLLTINGRKCGVHQIIWAMTNGHWQPKGTQIDHINGNPADNRPCNLRLATRSQNQANSHYDPAERGVTQRLNGCWEARIRVRGKPIYLGYFPSKDLAIKAYKDAATMYFGEFASHARY